MTLREGIRAIKVECRWIIATVLIRWAIDLMDPEADDATLVAWINLCTAAKVCTLNRSPRK